MSPRPRAALALAAVAATALVLPAPVVIAAVLAVAAATTVDALTARRPPRIERRAPKVLARGVPAPLQLEVEEGRDVRVRQPLPPDLGLDRREADGELRASLVGRRRGRHLLPAPAARVDGPLGLGCWYHQPGEESEVLVYPDLPGARGLASAVRQGHFRQEGALAAHWGWGPSSSPSAPTCPTTTSARSTGARRSASADPCRTSTAWSVTATSSA